MKLARAEIERLVPHAGAMCLLDCVTQWSPASISCTSPAPAAGHPLAGKRGVPAIVATEYAAQATAVHGALIEDANAPRAGMLATLMDVQLATATIPSDGGPLAIRVDLLGRSAAGCMYSFEVGTARATIASGRLLVALAEIPT
jgi:predicted hotdog family 3-hydroxylacyl-ACP dehydratase